MDLATTITTSGIVALLVNVIGLFWAKERLKQSIKYEYEQDLAKLKNSLEFDLDKKKKLYEGKLSQYKKYYSMMDSYSTDSRKTLFKGFETGILDLLQDPSVENTLKYIKYILTLQGNLSDTFLTFKNEMNGLRLEAGEHLLKLLDQYITVLESTQKKTVDFLGWMNTNAAQFVAEPDAVNEKIQEFMGIEFQTEGKELLELQKNIFQEMRRELGIV